MQKWMLEGCGRQAVAITNLIPTAIQSHQGAEKKGYNYRASVIFDGDRISMPPMTYSDFPLMQ